jgi:RHS repeat-associated protein
MKEQSEFGNVTSQLLRAEGGMTKSDSIQIPSVSLPKGGGAIKGIDEKFSVNAVNGTASFSIPLPFSPARGASPTLNLNYNSGAGNGIFGLGWTLGMASVKRKTDGELPRYLDAQDSDTYLFSEAEDLVPEFKKENDGSFSMNAEGNYVIAEKDSPDGLCTIRYYRPRTEGLFARIERWTENAGGIIKWRITTRDNLTTLFGWTFQARINEPGNPNKIFSWFPEFVFDDKGNCSHTLYKKEDNTGIDVSLPYNRNRSDNGNITYTNLYPEKVLYGNLKPCKSFMDPFPPGTDYCFQTVFDYGEYNTIAPYDKINTWNTRNDAFSTYNAGFEIRTTRLCRRVLLFHFFNELPGGSALIKSLNFGYESSGEEDFTFLKSVTSYGYISKPDGSYSLKNLPPVEFDYQKHDWNKEVKTILAEDLIDDPLGIDESEYHFTDLYNEGLSGILREQGNAWFYKHNLGNGQFERARLVSHKPSFNGLGTHLQLLDLDADGSKQLVNLENEPKGFFELQDDETWIAFRPFENLPNINLGNNNARLLDLNGDGKAEILIAGDREFTWYESRGRKGFGDTTRIFKPYDEEAGPNILFANRDQRIFLADMSGDGLTDIVRIRNGEVCYWPNLGYGHFGRKVTMDNPPVFDHPDVFNPVYLQLTDIDGSGTTDIIYLGRNRFSCWKNLSGNRFSTVPFEIDSFPEINNHTKVTVTDLLGNGVACIVWSGNLSKDAGIPLKYIDLMTGRKPHIMISYKNNLGKEVSMEYSPSTRFYLEDKLAGKPWITRVPFPVHCISKTETRDVITGSLFVSSYKYHHAYLDHSEREFRGFGLVEQTDTEDFEHWEKGNASNIINKAFHQPPVVTKNWFHTGAPLKKDEILGQYSREYWFEELTRQCLGFANIEQPLPEAGIMAAPGMEAFVIDTLSAEEWQQAVRACKNMALRTEVFAKDAPSTGATAEQTLKELTPFTVSTRNCIIELIQPKGKNKYAIFMVKESETLTYNYERNTGSPRITHNINLKLDEYGNVLESATIVYPRLSPDLSLPPETQADQEKIMIKFLRNSLTNDVMDDLVYRLRLPSETKTYELKGVPKTKPFYSVNDFENILNDTRSDTVAYHEKDKLLTPGKAQKRLIENVRKIYCGNNLKTPLPLHQLESSGLQFESYQLAYTNDMITDIFGTRVNEDLIKEAKFVHCGSDKDWWIPSGQVSIIEGSETVADAQSRFLVPVSFIDSWGAKTKLKYFSNYYLFIEETEDAAGNKAKVDLFNFRTLSPQRMRDPNNNLSEVLTDELGMVKATAIFGKGNEADELSGLHDYSTPSEETILTGFFNASDAVQLYNLGKELLQHATARYVYQPDAYLKSGKPVAVASIIREEHFHVNGNSPIRLGFEYSGGLGQVVMKKVQAEPGPAKKVTVNPDKTYTISEIDTAGLVPPQIRWVGNGRSVVNNKGNAVKQYEPYFSVTHQFEDQKELVETGVSPLLFYDALSRVVRTEMPDGTLARKEFDSWKQTIYDQNDTIMESSWYHLRTNRLIDAELSTAGKDPALEKLAADKAEKHANTPTVLHFDALGRPVLQIDCNKDEGGGDIYYHSKSSLDIEGNLLSITDARENKVIHCKYDMLGSLVFQESMDAGKRRMLLNTSGKPMHTWDERNLRFEYLYDVLQRPLQRKVIGGEDPVPLNHIFDRIFYGESEPSPESKNLRGQVVKHYDTGGLLETPAYDFKGQPTSTIRKLFKNYKDVANWTDTNLLTGLESESYTFTTETDALKRITRQIAPDGSVITPFYNESGLLSKEIIAHKSPAITTIYIKEIEYNEKGQRNKIIYGNDVTTKFFYDKESFRLRQIESKLSNGDPLQDWRYTYDAVGNIIHIKDNNVPVAFFNNQKITGECQYTYDAIYRLVAASGRENDAILSFGTCDNWNDKPFLRQMNPGDPMAIRNYFQTFQYDEAGNIKQIRHQAPGNNWTRNFNYESGNNRLKSTQVGQNGNLFDFTDYEYHPENGFITKLPHLEKIGWNFKDEVQHTWRQHCTEDNIPVITYYQYDGQGQRIRKITENQASAGQIPTKKEERIYFGKFELYMKHSGANAGLQRISLNLTDRGHRFVTIETRNDIIDGTEKQLIRYQLQNHLGSANLELDGNSNPRVISYEEFHPYGTTAYQAKNIQVKSASKRYRYTGVERDEESGLSYHSARYYLPWLGRWLSPDPKGYVDGTNLYIYSRNNPVSFVDTSGTESGFWDSIGSFFRNVWSGIKSAASKVWEWTKYAAGKTWEWTKTAIGKAWEWTKSAVIKAWDWTKSAAGKVWEWTKSAARSSWEVTKTVAKFTWNWILAPLVRTATNALAGAVIGFFTGGVTGAITGGIIGGITGAIHGWAMASAHSYNWGSGSGWLSFLADNTWALPNSTIGSLFATFNILGENPIDRTNSRDSNALMFDKEWFSGYATTLGNVIVGTKGLSAEVIRHEQAHVFQARVFGPIFYPTMAAHYAVNTLFPYWLFYHNTQYPDLPITSIGEYFSRGVYPHTWAEEWGYAVGGRPN